MLVIYVAGCQEYRATDKAEKEFCLHVIMIYLLFCKFDAGSVNMVSASIGFMSSSVNSILASVILMSALP